MSNNVPGTKRTWYPYTEMCAAFDERIRKRVLHDASEVDYFVLHALRPSHITTNYYTAVACFLWGMNDVPRLYRMRRK